MIAMPVVLSCLGVMSGLTYDIPGILNTWFIVQYDIVIFFRNVLSI